MRQLSANPTGRAQHRLTIVRTTGSSGHLDVSAQEAGTLLRRGQRRIVGASAGTTRTPAQPRSELGSSALKAVPVNPVGRHDYGRAEEHQAESIVGGRGGPVGGGVLPVSVCAGPVTFIGGLGRVAARPGGRSGSGRRGSRG
jgi:hypothetical protein